MYTEPLEVPPSAMRSLRPASIPRAGIMCRSTTALFYLVGGTRALPWHPQQAQNRHPPTDFFFLLPLTRSRRRAGFVRGLCAESRNQSREL
jgi:hypothetical protein